jgi:hypothetical protein
VTVAVPTPTPTQHHLEGVVVDAPPILQRFEKAAVQEGGRAHLTNPIKIPEDKRKEGELEGWDVRYYDPEVYAKTGQMVEHDKSFGLEERDEMKKILKKNLSGDVASSVESSNKPRDYVQERRRLSDGTLIRPVIDASSLF